jgi:hypothetical protein
LIVAGAALLFSQAAMAEESGQSSDKLNRSVLPPPVPPFKGKIGRTAADSTPDFPKGVTAPEGAPNVLLILTDDVGFGASSTFGGPIQTPNLQRLADSGLRYNMFHTTALRAGPVCLNNFSASISGASAGVRLPSGVAAG